MPRIKPVMNYIISKHLCKQEIELESVYRSRLVTHSSNLKKSQHDLVY